ncbi:MAG: nucleotidyltransferase family protein [Verrucomicrobiota bacterium]|jgi:molybdenum cofactor cytidylyltransferase
MEGDANNLARRLGVVLLAAGISRRMERPKLLLSWGGTSIAGHQIGLWNGLGVKQIAIVCAAGDKAMQAELARIHFPAENRIVNHAPQQGMFSSIRCAARWAGWSTGLTHWAITLGDQPHLRPQTLLALLECAATYPGKVCQPCRHGHLRHPVLMPKTVFLQLETTPQATLKDFLDKLPESATGCDVDDPGLSQDIDTPADYEKALALYISRQNSSS